MADLNTPDPTQAGLQSNLMSSLSDYNSLALSSDQLNATKSDLQDATAGDKRIERDEEANLERQPSIKAPQQDTNLMSGLAPLLFLTAFGGAKTKVGAMGMLAATNGIVQGYTSGRQEVYDNAVKQYQESYKAFQDHQAQLDAVYKEMRQAYKGRIDADVKALQFARAVTGDQVKSAANALSNYEKQKEFADKMQLNYHKLSTSMDHMREQMSIQEQRLALAKEKAAASGGGAGFSDPKVGDLLGALTERGVALPAGMRSKQQMAATLQGLIARNPDKSADQIADMVKSGQLSFKEQSAETSSVAKREANVDTAMAANTGPGGLFDQLDAAAKKVNFGDLKPASNARLATQQHLIANPDIQNYRGLIHDVRAEMSQILARSGQATDLSRRNAEAMFPLDASYAELKKQIDASRKVADAVTRGNKAVMDRLKAGEDVDSVASTIQGPSSGWGNATVVAK